MARIDLNNVTDNWSAALYSGISNSSTACDLKSSGATGSPDTKFMAVIDSEIVQVTAVATDTPSAGKDRLTIVRGYGGSAASSHLAGALVLSLVVAAQTNQSNTQIDNLRTMGFYAHGDDGVQRSDGATDLLTQETAGTPTMGVVVDPGAAMVDGQVTGLISQFATELLTAPSVNPRKDLVQITQDGEIEIKTGTEAASPVAPTVDADALALAVIDHRVGESSIKDTDDSSNGYITDSRAFL